MAHEARRRAYRSRAPPLRAAAGAGDELLAQLVRRQRRRQRARRRERRTVRPHAPVGMARDERPRARAAGTRPALDGRRLRLERRRALCRRRFACERTRARRHRQRLPVVPDAAHRRRRRSRAPSRDVAIAQPRPRASRQPRRDRRASRRSRPHRHHSLQRPRRRCRKDPLRGLTVPEMAALMGALGCRRAVSLDGGISGQLAVREAGGELRKWTAWRLVPLGLLVLPQPTASAVH